MNDNSKTKWLNGCRTLNLKFLHGDQNIYIVTVVKGEITKRSLTSLVIVWFWVPPPPIFLLFLKHSSFAKDEINIYL